MSGGTALPPTVKSFMEPRFGADFGSVRIHTGENAAQLSQSLNARAFTVGNHVFFGRNQFQPANREGKSLIAHELTHTIQQGHAVQRSIQREEGDGILSGMSKLLDGLSTEGAVRLAISTAAPGLTPIMQKGGIKDMLAEQAMSAVDNVFGSVKKPLDRITGVGEQVAAAIGPIVETIQVAGTQIAKNDCSPIRAAAEKIEQIAMRLLTPVVELVQPVVAGIKQFLDDVWKKIGAPILDWIKDSAAEQWRLIKMAAGLVQDAAIWLWDKTAGIREPYIQMWNMLKNWLGIGDSPDGRNGILQWVEQKLTEAWDAIKLKLAPYTEQLKAVGTAVGAVILALSPVGPMLALGAAAIELGKGISWVAANWGKGNIMATARAFVEKTLIPPLASALDKVTATVSNIANSISASLSGLAASLTKTAALVGNTAIGFIIKLTQWLSDQAQSLAAFVNGKLGELKLWLSGAFDKLAAFLRKVMNFLSRVGDVIIDIYGLPVLLGEAIWNAVPQCIRDPIVDFLGPIILRQIELFDELVKDDEAWKKTKEEVGRLIKLVFHDKNLIGAIKAVFMFVLRIFNLPPDLLATVAAKAMGAWDQVTKKPLEFIKSTIKAIAQGFKIIWDDKLENIKNGLQGWLLGEIKDKNIVMPTNWTDLGQIFEFVLSVLGISVDHVYELLEKRFPGRAQKFRQIVGKITRIMEWVDKSIDVTKSPKDNAAGMLNQAKDFGLTLLESGAEWIIKKVAAKVTEEIVKAAATAGFGAILTAAQSLYAALLTAKKWMRQILDMANRGLDNVMDLVNGSFEKVGGVFAELMKKGMPVVIGFLADQVGLGDVGRELGKAIDKLRAKVDTAILWIIDKIKAGIDWLIGLAKKAVAAIQNWWEQRRPIEASDGKPHELYMQGGENSAEIMVKSTPKKLTKFLKDIIDDPESDVSKPKATKALEYYEANLATALKVKSKKEDEVAAFEKKFTQMSKLLVDLFGEHDLPSKPNWSWASGQARVASVEDLSPKGVTTGGLPDDKVKGWDALQFALLTKKRGDWKQMHMITAAVGGTGEKKNIVPAPTGINSGSVVRGFEVRLEALLKTAKKPNVVWVKVATTGFYPASVGRPKDTSYDGSTFATGVKMELGRQIRNPSKQWQKMAPEMVATVSIPLPSFDGAAVDINSIGRVYIEKVLGITEHYAKVIVDIRGGGYTSIDDITLRLSSHEKASPHRDEKKFNDTIKKLVRAYARKKISFGGKEE